jgi:soluble lytic murein transglycosylase-like protein
MTNLKSVIAMVTVLLLSAFAYADPSPTEAAMAQLIVDETKHAVPPAEAAHIVDAVFTNAQRYSVDPFLIMAVMRQESRFKPNVRNRYGATGLMQIVPRFHRDKLKGRSPFNIDTNIQVGTQILADCLDDYKGKIHPALRCYSGNARNYAALLKAGHTLARKADLLYRFQNGYPLVDASRFENPRGTTATSVSAASSVVFNPTPPRATLLAAGH